MKTLPISICMLHQLQRLSLEDCISLEELPSNIRFMISLSPQVFRPYHNANTMGRHQMTSLRTFSTGGCDNLVTLSEEMQNLIHL